jgi:signal transduction histidine kinase
MEEINQSLFLLGALLVGQGTILGQGSAAIPLLPWTFDLAETVESTLDMMAERAHGGGIELAGAMQPAMPTRLRGDPGRLRQILFNLIGNAIKFTERGEVVLTGCEKCLAVG